MSQFNIYLKDLPDYLSQWLRHEFWDDDTARVCFPKQSVENLLSRGSCASGLKTPCPNVRQRLTDCR